MQIDRRSPRRRGMAAWLLTGLAGLACGAPVAHGDEPVEFMLGQRFRITSSADAIDSLRLTLFPLQHAEVELQAFAYHREQASSDPTHLPWTEVWSRQVQVRRQEVLEQDAIWIGVPPAPIIWHDVTVDPPLDLDGGELLMGFGVDLDTALAGSGITPSTIFCGTPPEEVEEGAGPLKPSGSALMSTDQGLTWQVVTEAALSQVIGEPVDFGCVTEGSATMQIHVRPRR